MKRAIAAAAAVGFLGVLSTNATAQDGSSGPDFTFGASTSYVYDFNSPKGGSGFNALTYANQEPRDEAFNIDLLQLGISGQRGRASYRAAIDFGDLAGLADNTTDADISLQEAWLAYDLENVGVLAGRFNTPIGYEVLEPWGNAHISRSWGWQAQPINHNGIQAHGHADIIEVTIGVVNSFTVASNPVPPSGVPAPNETNNDKGVVASFNAAVNDQFNFYMAGIYNDNDNGPEVKMLNAIASGGTPFAGEQVTYAVEGNWRQNNPTGASDLDFYNIALYLGTTYGPTNVNVRADYTDDDGIVTPTSTNIWSVTVDLSWALVEGMDFRIEYRHDDADDSVFGDGSSTSDTDDTVQAQLLWYPEL